MNELYELKDKLMKELEEYGNQELSAGSLEVVDKLSHAIKNICKIIEAYKMEEDEYSMNMGEGSNYSRRNSYGYSRNDGYSREGGNRSRYSRTGGYSRGDGVAELVESVRGMMHELPQNLQIDAKKFVTKLEQEM